MHGTLSADSIRYQLVITVEASGCDLLLSQHLQDLIEC